MKFCAFLIVLLATLASAQEQENKSYTYDCSKLTVQSAGSVGCPSYNDMVLHHDKDILEAFKNATETFVCFRRALHFVVFRNVLGM
jgi:hypothetical protein